MGFVALSNGEVVEDTDEFRDLYQLMREKGVNLDQYEYDYVGELKPRRVSVETRLSDNIVNHVAVVCGLNYTVSFPAEQLKGVRVEDIEEAKADKVRRAYDRVATTILSSNADSIDQTLQVIQRVQLNNDLDRHAVNVFSRTVENCYNDFYAEYWNRVKTGLEVRAKQFERILNAIRVLDHLERIVKKKFSTESLECFIVDVFRNGGGIYYVLPNRIILTSSNPFILHLGIGHEGGHIMTRGWQKQTSILNELNLLGSKIGKMKYLKGYIDECLAALIQLKMGQYILHENRKTHGFMNDAFFRILDSQWENYMQNPENRIEDLLLNAIRKAMKDEEVVSEIRKRVCMGD